MPTLGKNMIAGNATRIEDLLELFPPDQRSVRFIFNSDEAGYLVYAELAFPDGPVVATNQAPVRDHCEAIDEVVRSLAAQVSA